MQLLDTASVLPDFLLIFLALCFLLELAYFSEPYAGRLGTGLLLHNQDWNKVIQKNVTVCLNLYNHFATWHCVANNECSWMLQTIVAAIKWKQLKQSFKTIQWHLCYQKDLKQYILHIKLQLCTFKHKNATYPLSMSKWAVTVQEVGERRKHVMTNKQHTKFTVRSWLWM